MCHPTNKTDVATSLQEDSHSSSRRPRRAVAFDKLEIYGFPKVLGDHPSAEGPPLRLDATPEYRLELHVDDYERRRAPRRQAEELRLSSLQRETYLLATGYRYDEVVEAAQRNQKQQRERWESYQDGHLWEPYLLVLENVRDWIKGFLQWGQGPHGRTALCLFLLAYVLSFVV